MADAARIVSFPGGRGLPCYILWWGRVFTRALSRQALWGRGAQTIVLHYGRVGRKIKRSVGNFFRPECRRRQREPPAHVAGHPAWVACAAAPLPARPEHLSCPGRAAVCAPPHLPATLRQAGFRTGVRLPPSRTGRTRRIVAALAPPSRPSPLTPSPRHRAVHPEACSPPHHHMWAR